MDTDILLVFIDFILLEKFNNFKINVLLKLTRISWQSSEKILNLNRLFPKPVIQSSQKMCLHFLGNAKRKRKKENEKI